MSLPLYRGFSISPTKVGQGQTAIGTTVVVLNTDSEALTGNSVEQRVDPWNIRIGGSTNAGNVRPCLVNSAGLYLDLLHVYTGPIPANVLEVKTAPQVRVFGKLPPWQGEPQKIGEDTGRIWPQDANPLFPDMSTVGWWVPLPDTDGNVVITLSEGEVGRNTIMYNPASGQDMRISNSKFVYLGGCVEIMALIERIAVFNILTTPSSSSSEEPTAGATIGMVIGRLTG